MLHSIIIKHVKIFSHLILPVYIDIVLCIFVMPLTNFGDFDGRFIIIVYSFGYT